MAIHLNFKNGSLALTCAIGPTSRSKGTRRPLAVLKFCFYQGSAASLKLSERRTPYRNVGPLMNLGLLVNVKRCCHSPATTPRFDARIGDTVLIDRSGVLIEATIQSAQDHGLLVVLEDGTSETVSRAQIVALMLD